MNVAPSKNILHSDRNPSSEAATVLPSLQSLKVPVCGMKVTPQSPNVVQHEGHSVYFCRASCKSKFAADPAKYPFHLDDQVEMVPVVTEPVVAGTIYTCPMHPEVQQDHPGACPKCGMALEPEMPVSNSVVNFPVVSAGRFQRDSQKPLRL
ncbi:heavy metal-binding domain-containing protein, partial [Undibacterium sp. RTI2.2]|uniref:heavy metal-binding domain-containing protein n=1 Tax=unclassified Undibacterium TaxID=2630295 RepID=UPI003A599148